MHHKNPAKHTSILNIGLFYRRRFYALIAHLISHVGQRRKYSILYRIIVELRLLLMLLLKGGIVELSIRVSPFIIFSHNVFLYGISQIISPKAIMANSKISKNCQFVLSPLKI